MKPAILHLFGPGITALLTASVMPAKATAIPMPSATPVIAPRMLEQNTAKFS